MNSYCNRYSFFKKMTAINTCWIGRYFVLFLSSTMFVYPLQFSCLAFILSSCSPKWLIKQHGSNIIFKIYLIKVVLKQKKAIAGKETTSEYGRWEKQWSHVRGKKSEDDFNENCSAHYSLSFCLENWDALIFYSHDLY